MSKILAPALRIGWLTPAPRLRDEVVAAEQEADLGNPVLAQPVRGDLLESGRLERHLRTVRRRHRRRRDAMIAALRRHLPAATVHGAAAGLHLTVTFDEPRDRSMDDITLATRALAAGAKVQPLSWPPGPARSAGAGARRRGRLDRAHRGGDDRPRLGRRQPAR